MFNNQSVPTEPDPAPAIFPPVHPIQEPEPDRMPDEEPLPNPDETRNPPIVQ